MSRTKQTTATESFEKLGIDPADYTRAMTNAVKQRWGNLPTAKTVEALRADLAAVTVAETPTADRLVMDLIATIPDGIERAAKAESEAKRLAANAKVNAWRERGRIQAALDARSLYFARLRTGKAKTAAPADPAPQTAGI